MLITITLLAFLVVLLVGLATYTRVETAIAGNTQRQAQARQNALVALNIAVSQLQKYAGPDTRVTATAEDFANVDSQKRHYTGVWHSDPTASADVFTPLAWLVSGIETGNPEDVTASIPNATRVALTGPKTDGTAFLANGAPGAGNVVAPLQDIRAPGVPGLNGLQRIGRYAWWIGDQGVKAPVAVPDRTDSVTYAPWDTADARIRLRQQIALGAGAADANGAPIFEPLSANNAKLAANTMVTNQIAYFNKSTSGTVGLTTLQQNFHAWSPNNLNVLSSTAPAGTGLRRDLSLDPSILGAGFVKWADYVSYMEQPSDAALSPFPPLPAFGADPLRRRYIMQPITTADGAIHSVAPVLSYFFLTFNIRTKAGSATVQPLEVRARWMLSLWNPYASALVPENLRIEVTGLPDVRVDDETAVSPPLFPSPPIPFSLQQTYGSPLMISLPWDGKPPTGTSGEDRLSWLPGRTYTWTSKEDVTGSAPASPGYDSNFYSRSISTTSGRGVILDAPNSRPIDGDHVCHIDGDAQTIIVKLFAVRSGSDVPLGTFTSQPFDSFTTTSGKISQDTYQFSYVFRLAESTENPAWLSSALTDPHQGSLNADSFAYGPNGPSPAVYVNYQTISAPDRLLDRATDRLSYNEDAPVFELPRSPILSLGALQHLAVAGAPPFAIGNPAGINVTLNGQNAREFFDRYFFSGLTVGVVPPGTGNALVLPNPLLTPIPRKLDGTPVAVADLQAAPNAQSSKYLLQAGAFNINSTNAEAWSAILRSGRFSGAKFFPYVDSDFRTGSGSDAPYGTVQSGDAQFFRFSQSAQETFKADAGYAASTVDPASSVPDVPSAANTHLFRKGMKTLSAGVVRAMADRIVEYVQRKHAASGTDGGPFRTLEEFIAPSALFQDANGNSRTLLEAAIADAATSGGESANGLVGEFSSQWLTQADILTALAPVLFPRSDTFVIRAYGDTLNPVLSTAALPVVEGRAWCEAIVQRVPEYFDPSVATGDPAETAPAALRSPFNQTYGRRFKIISFRWLTRSDI